MYAERNPRELEPHFSQHMDAMTAEGLHDKGAIARELAWRDQDRAALKSAIADIFCAYAEADDPGLAAAIERATNIADSTDL